MKAEHRVWATDLGALRRGGGERDQRHHAGPEGSEAAGQTVDNRPAEHHLQREPEDDHQEQGETQQHVPAQRHRDGESPPAAVAQPGQKQRGQDGHQPVDEVVGHVEVRHGCLGVRVAGVNTAVLDHHLQGGGEETAAQLLQHQRGLDPPEHREGALAQAPRDHGETFTDRLLED